MCGICGFTGPRRPKVLHTMNQRLHHRGPDGVGYWQGEGASLAMSRLAIVDVAAGKQPLFNEDGTIVVVFNGEIYNHGPLRRSLEEEGHLFPANHGDGEVIPHLYERYGVDFLTHLVGMFAIALWDDRQQTLLLARDHFGIKPLCYSNINGQLAFASEIKSLLVLPEISRQPDLLAIHHYFSFKHVPAPLSAFRQICHLPAASRLIWQQGRQPLVERWWHLPEEAKNPPDEKTAAATILALLRQSVASQMVADVPIGAYLSGGVDSSAVVALLSELGAGRIKTFTLVYDDSFPGKQADGHFARQVAKERGVEQYECLLRQEEIIPALHRVVECFDEPFSGVISSFFLSELIGQHVKVALSGDGADELFGSYLPHRLAQPLANWQRGLSSSAHLAPFEEQTGLLAAILARGDEAAQRMGQYIADDATKQKLYAPALQEAIVGQSSEEMIRQWLALCPSQDPLNRMLWLDIHTLLPDQVLTFVDRLAMAHSVEVRPPFLDHRLAEFVATLPGAIKIRRGRVKHILKEAVTSLLPKGVIDRPKEGFLMPVNAWLLAGLRPWAESVLTPRRLARHGLIEVEQVGRLLAEHYAGLADHGNRLWNLLMFQLWWEGYQ